MIQRIQSIWLLIAALVMLTIFYVSIFQFDNNTIPPLTVGKDFIAIILVVLSMAISIVTIFLYKRRKQQISLTWLNILACVGLQAWLLISINNKAAEGHYWIGAFIPIVTLVFLVMAIAGMRKDEKLIKSLNRLR